MDFSRVALAEGDQAFLDEAREFLKTHATEDVRSRDAFGGEIRLTGVAGRGHAESLSGEVRLSPGYTEPEGGSDIATCKTRAVRHGAEDGLWVVNGSKMSTTGAHKCQYAFLITNTDPEAPKHKNLTMFLVPLDSPGIEIQGPA